MIASIPVSAPVYGKSDALRSPQDAWNADGVTHSTWSTTAMSDLQFDRIASGTRWRDSSPRESESWNPRGSGSVLGHRVI
jgi:hypothetical protein